MRFCVCFFAGPLSSSSSGGSGSSTGAFFAAFAATVVFFGGRPRFFGAGAGSGSGSGSISLSSNPPNSVPSSSSWIASICSFSFALPAFRFVFETRFPASLPLASASSSGSKPAVPREAAFVAVDVRVDLRELEAGVLAGTLDDLVFRVAVEARGRDVVARVPSSADESGELSSSSWATVDVFFFEVRADLDGGLAWVRLAGRPTGLG